MTTLEEVADTLNGTLQEDTDYRGKYILIENLATFDVSELGLKDYIIELLEGINESEDGELFRFTFTENEQGKEGISITKK